MATRQDVPPSVFPAPLHNRGNLIGDIVAEFPALPLFTDAYLADTRHLTTIQHGAYLLLLMTAWRSPECSLPDDDTYLARISGMDKRTWMVNRGPILAFWHLNDAQKWVQGRLKDERNFVEQKRSKNVAAGRASALKRLNRGSTPVQPDGNETSTPTPTPTPTKKDSDTDVSSSPPTPPKKFVRPEWIPESDWQDFVAYRGKGFTTRAKELIVDDLQQLRDSGHDPGAVLRQSIKRNWTGVFEIKTNQRKGTTHGKHTEFAKQDYRAGIEGFDVV